MIDNHYNVQGEWWWLDQVYLRKYVLRVLLSFFVSYYVYITVHDIMVYVKTDLKDETVRSYLWFRG